MTWYDLPAEEISKNLERACAERDKVIADRAALLAACKLAIVQYRHLGQALGELTPPGMVDAWNAVEAAIAQAERDIS